MQGELSSNHTEEVAKAKKGALGEGCTSLQLTDQEVGKKALVRVIEESCLE